MAGSKQRRRPQKYPEELRERAVRMVFEVREQTGEKHGVVTRVARELGVGTESLRNWVNQAEVDSGRRAGTSTADGHRIAALEKENRELRRANDMAESTGGRTGPVTIRVFRSQERCHGRGSYTRTEATRVPSSSSRVAARGHRT